VAVEVAEVEEEEATKILKKQVVEVATEQLVMHHTKETEEAEVAVDEVEKEIKTVMSQNLTNKRKIKIQLKINSTVFSELQLLRTPRNRLLMTTQL
jgi:hypothetical protein